MLRVCNYVRCESAQNKWWDEVMVDRDKSCRKMLLCVVIQCSCHYRLHSPVYSLPVPGDEASCPGVLDMVVTGVYQQKCDDSLVAPSTPSPGSQQGTAENQGELFSFGSPPVENEAVHYRYFQQVKEQFPPPLASFYDKRIRHR